MCQIPLFPMSATAPAPPYLDLQLALSQWRQASPAPLLLDLRSPSAHAARRLSPSACVHWRQLESAWFTLPAYGIEFAVLLPDEAEEEQADSEWRRKHAEQSANSGSTSASALPPTAPDEEGIEDDAPAAGAAGAAASSSGALGVKARSKSGPPPLSPSSPAFRFSRESILQLLRFYGWRVPDAWAWSDSAELWAAAQAAGVAVHDHRQPVTQHLLFSPAAALQLHFDEICQALHKQRQDAAASADPDSPLLQPKQARPADASCVSSTAGPEAASTAPSSASPSPLMCLDVACGSGRDLCWLLWHEAQQRRHSPNPNAALVWAGVGVDCAAGALQRAQQLADQLGVADRVQLRRARINQQTGQWHVSGKADGGGESAGDPEPMGASADGAGDATAAASSVACAAPPSATALKPSQQQRREKRKKKEALRAAAAASITAPDAAVSSSYSSSSSSSSSFLPPASFDLIVCVRFLCRSVIRTQLRRLLRPGGFFLLSTFIDDGVTSFAQPANPQFRIAGKAELERLAAEAGMEMVCNNIGRAEDGRPLSDCVMRKPIVANSNNS